MRATSTAHIEENYSDCTKIFTDGSKDPKNRTVGAAFVVPELNIEKQIKLDPTLSVFTSELVAIQHAVQWIIDSKIPKSVILTDSLSAIQTIKSGTSKSRPDITMKILSLLDTAIINNIEVKIDWVLSHIGIPGNEAAGVAAKTIGTPDPTLPAKAEIYTVIKKAINRKWQAQWNVTNKGREYRHGQENVKTTCTVCSPNRRLNVAYTRLRLHHCGLGFHKAFDLKLCKLYTEGDGETIDHIFVYCEAQGEHRRNLEAKMFKLGYITFDSTTLLFPPPNKRPMGHGSLT